MNFKLKDNIKIMKEVMLKKVAKNNEQKYINLMQETAPTRQRITNE